MPLYYISAVCSLSVIRLIVGKFLARRYRVRSPE